MAIKGEEERSMPWAENEYIKLGKYRLCYTTCKDGKARQMDMVAIPGGQLLYVENFLHKYPNAVMPRVLRK